jgi:GNAT superfamily N-acetyltransferase
MTPKQGKPVIFREMQDTDWDEIIELVRRQWFDAEEQIPTQEAKQLAAVIDMRILLKRTTYGILAIDEETGRIIGVTSACGPDPLPKRIQGWHEIAVSKALERADEIGGGIAAGLHALEAEMRHFMSEMHSYKPRDYDGEITLLLLDPAYQKQGIGRQMMKQAVEWTRSQGSTILFVNTDDTLDYTFYEHLGWKRVAEYPTPVEIFGKVYDPNNFIYELDISTLEHI